MQKIIHKVKRYVIGLIKFFAIFETAAVLAYLFLKIIGDEGVTLLYMLSSAAIYYCIVVAGMFLFALPVKVGIIIYDAIKSKKG